jgi:hypothetical protein
MTQASSSAVCSGAGTVTADDAGAAIDAEAATQILTLLAAKGGACRLPDIMPTLDESTVLPEHLDDARVVRRHYDLTVVVC